MNLSVIPSDHIDELIEKSMLYRYSRKFLRELKEYKKTNDSEALHQLRVYSRRLLATFDFFSTNIPAEIKEKGYKKIKQFHNALNLTRDSHVQIKFFKRLCKDNIEYKSVCSEIIHFIRKQDIKHKKELVNTFKRISKSHILFEILQFSKQKQNKTYKQLSPSNIKIFGSYCAKMVRPLLTKFNNNSRNFPDSEMQEELHKCRLLVKKIRYNLEILKPFFHSLNKYFKIILEFQTKLGEIQDCNICMAYLDKFELHLSKEKIKYSNEEHDKYFEKLNKIKALRISERKNSHQQLIRINKKITLADIEKNLLNIFTVKSKQ